MLKAAEILERTIPKMVDIEFHGDGRLWSVKADPVLSKLLTFES